MPLILSVLGQTGLCFLVLVTSSLVTVVPDARGSFQTFQIVLALITILGLVASILLIVMYRQRPLFKSRAILASSLVVLFLSGFFVVFGIFL